MVHVKCTLHGSLEDNLPDGKNTVELEFEQLPSVEQILKRLSINQEYLQFVLDDGQYVELEDWPKAITSEHIQLWPRIAGG